MHSDGMAGYVLVTKSATATMGTAGHAGGAAVGGAIGSIVPVVGTAFGAAVGGALGRVGGTIAGAATDAAKFGLKHGKKIMGAKLGTNALTGAPKTGKEIAVNIAQNAAQNAAQQRQQAKESAEQRSMAMADKAKANAAVSKALLQDIHDDLSLIKSLQLPSRISEQLREDIMALDNNHEIVETGEETTVNNANPFMSEIIQRLYDKDNPVDEEEEKPAHVPQHLFY